MEHGTRDSRTEAPSLAARLVHTVGFITLAAAAAAVLAGVMILPEYARWARTEHELAREQALTDELQSLRDAQARLIAALDNDPVLIKRLAVFQAGLTPADENEFGPAEPHLPPGVIHIEKRNLPPAPAGPAIALAGRVEDPATRRGLLLLAAAALLCGMFLFAPAERRPKGTGGIREPAQSSEL